jgi:RNA polymerase sigma-70 factor (ECF subfamily)
MKDCNIFEVWEEHRPSLFNYIKKRVGDSENSKDILQDVLWKSYQFCSTGKQVLYIKSWLFKITHHAIIDFYKTLNKETTLIADTQTDQHEYSLVGEASEYIKALLKLLPEKYAVPLVMSDLENIDQKTIAVKLNMTLSNTKSRIQRARMKLKQQFLKCCVVEFDDQGAMIRFDIKPTCRELQSEKKPA